MYLLQDAWRGVPQEEIQYCTSALRSAAPVLRRLGVQAGPDGWHPGPDLPGQEGRLYQRVSESSIGYTPAVWIVDREEYDGAIVDAWLGNKGLQLTPTGRLGVEHYIHGVVTDIIEDFDVMLYLAMPWDERRNAQSLQDKHPGAKIASSHSNDFWGGAIMDAWNNAIQLLLDSDPPTDWVEPVG